MEQEKKISLNQWDIKIPRLLVFGQTGHGKSTLLNLLIGQHKFFKTGADAQAVTTQPSVQKQQIDINGELKSFYLTDTVGLFDANIQLKQNGQKMLHTLLGKLGFMNVILLVTIQDRVSKNIIDAIKELIMLYGNQKAILDHCIIVRAKSDFSEYALYEMPIQDKQRKISEATSKHFEKDKDHDQVEIFDTCLIDSLLVDPMYVKLKLKEESQKQNAENQFIKLKNLINKKIKLNSIPLVYLVVQSIEKYFDQETLIKSKHQNLLSDITIQCHSTQIYQSKQTWQWKQSTYQVRLIQQLQQNIQKAISNSIIRILQSNIEKIIEKGYQYSDSKINYLQFLQILKQKLSRIDKSNSFVSIAIGSLTAVLRGAVAIQSLSAAAAATGAAAVSGGAALAAKIGSLGIGLAVCVGVKFLLNVLWNKEDSTNEIITKIFKEYYGKKQVLLNNLKKIIQEQMPAIIQVLKEI